MAAALRAFLRVVPLIALESTPRPLGAHPHTHTHTHCIWFDVATAQKLSNGGLASWFMVSLDSPASGATTTHFRTITYFSSIFVVPFFYPISNEAGISIQPDAPSVVVSVDVEAFWNVCMVLRFENCALVLTYTLVYFKEVEEVDVQAGGH